MYFTVYLMMYLINDDDDTKNVDTYTFADDNDDDYVNRLQFSDVDYG